MGLNYKTAGESHGEALVALIEGMPSDLVVDLDYINQELSRRQGGYGRGGRMKIEKDKAQILSGVRDEKTIGSPIALYIKNKDHRIYKEEPLTRARPGHADLAGAMKYGFSDMRHVLERASARETAARVAAGALAKLLLREFNIKIISMVTTIGEVSLDSATISSETIVERAEKSPLRCVDESVTQKMIAVIDEARAVGDTLGGVFEIRALNVPPGLGSYVDRASKLDAQLAMSLMSINAIKGVEVGAGFLCASTAGSDIHDQIGLKKNKSAEDTNFERITNRAGGIEGGVSNGEEIVLRAAMKPIATLRQPLKSVDIKSKQEIAAQYERSDVCAVAAASIVGEAEVAFVIAQALLRKFGGDNILDTLSAYQAYKKRLSQQF